MKHKHSHRLVSSIIFFTATAAILFFLYYNGFSDITVYSDCREDQIKVACVGDSVTYGYGIKNQPDNNYPVFLNELLGDDYHVANFGNIRVTVQPDGDQPYINTYSYSDSIEYDADILIFMLGTNDSKTINWQGAEKFKADYLDLLNSYLSGDKKPKVYLCTPAAALFTKNKTEGKTTYGIQPLVINEISHIIKEIADEYSYTVIDINSATQNRRELFSKDLVHPNYDGLKAIAQEIYNGISTS